MILLDMMMPVMNGWEFLKEIKKDHADSIALLPIVITSAAGESANKAAKEVSGFIKKPIDLDVLMMTVRKHCGPPPKR